MKRLRLTSAIPSDKMRGTSSRAHCLMVNDSVSALYTLEQVARLVDSGKLESGL